MSLHKNQMLLLQIDMKNDCLQLKKKFIQEIYIVEINTTALAYSKRIRQGGLHLV